MKAPKVQWATTPDGVRIAYQVLGEGPNDLLLCPGQWPNLDAAWDYPGLARFLTRLASFSRLILANPRGSGISDPPPGAVATIEDMATDLRSVLDAAGSDRVDIVGSEAGGLPSLFLSATSPDRVRAIVLVDAFASWRRHENYPWGFPDKPLDRFIEMNLDEFGTGENLRWLAPELYEDLRFRESWARLERLSMPPSTVRGLMRYAIWNFDVRGILSTVRAPTLVLTHTNHAYVRAGHSRYLADHITDAKYLESKTFSGIYWLHDVDWVLDEVQAFLTGTRGATDLDDRVLATVLFTDIVGSTEKAAKLGDRRWRRLLDDHDVLARREIDRFRGRAVKSTGDGIMATFDGPARAIRCASALNEAVRSLGIEIRTGLHTGEVEKRGEDVGGIAVHIAARVMSEAGPSEVLVSGAVPPLVAGSGLEFDDRGSHELKGVPGEWRLYAVKP